MLKEIFLSSIISTSISLKTSNDDTKPHDYEFMIQTEKKTDNYSYYIKRDWERELGNNYIDNILQFKYITKKNIYSGLDLASLAHDPSGSQQALHISGSEVGNALYVETQEGRPETLALAKNGQPT